MVHRQCFRKIDSRNIASILGKPKFAESRATLLETGRLAPTLDSIFLALTLVPSLIERTPVSVRLIP